MLNWFLLVGDFPQRPNLSQSHAGTHAKQPRSNLHTYDGQGHISTPGKTTDTPQGTPWKKNVHAYLSV